MPTHTFKPTLSVLRKSAAIVDTEVRWTSRGRQERKVVRTGSPSRSPQKSPQKGSSSKKPRPNEDDQPIWGFDNGPEIIGMEPLKLPKSKVGYEVWVVVELD